MRLSAPIFRLKRQAKLLARDRKIPLHEALDRMAVAEGFRSWSHLASTLQDQQPTERILASLNAGELLLMGARPGHGKTLLGLELAALAHRIARQGLFFTLDFNEGQVLDRLTTLGIDPAQHAGAPVIDTSDDICADHIIERLGETAGNAIAVVDYLQLLDQKRSSPPLGEQIRSLKSHAQKHGSILVMISQIDRTFERKDKTIPDLTDVRMPNPFELSLFDKTCFLHRGKIQMGVAA